MSSIKILYVEDELNLASIVKDTLTNSGYEVRLVSDGAEVIQATTEFSPDICLLDVMLPNIDGFTLGHQISNDFPDLPIIFLTAKNQTGDVLSGFKAGGNDYIKKPFSIEELMVRIDNVLALRSGTKSISKDDIVHIGLYEFDSQRQTLRITDDKRQLSFREVEVLQYCVERMNGQIIKRELLLKIWGDDSYYNARNLDVYIRKIRSYLADDPRISILTLRGVGYKFMVDDS